jgi:WD40 repeat protein
VRLWSIPDGAPLLMMAGHKDAVVDVAFSPDGTRLASASWDNTVRLWNIPQGSLAHFLTGHRDWVRSVAFHRMARCWFREGTIIRFASGRLEMERC